MIKGKNAITKFIDYKNSQYDISGRIFSGKLNVEYLINGISEYVGISEVNILVDGFYKVELYSLDDYRFITKLTEKTSNFEFNGYNLIITNKNKNNKLGNYKVYLD